MPFTNPELQTFFVFLFRFDWIMVSSSSSSCFYMLFLVMTTFYLLSSVRSSDVEALLSLKSSIDPSNSIPWRGTDLCAWEGVKECINRTRVTKLVLESMNLTGSLNEKSLNQLDQLRVLSLKGNHLSASVPNLSGLVNLKSLFLNDNNFSGEFPESLTSLHRLKTIVLAGNKLSGQIPSSLLRLSHLYTLHLQDNLFSGSVPPLNQTTLRYFNVSNNQLFGRIPLTQALKQFNESSFTGNIALCGDQIQESCRRRNDTGGVSSKPSAIPAMHPIAKRKTKTKLIVIIVGSIGGGIVLLLLMLQRRQQNKSKREECISKAEGATVVETKGDTSDRRNKSFSWERGSEKEEEEEEGSAGTLVFLGRSESDITAVRYSMDDLLKASAETLGRGTLGSTYKAVMESGFIVTVKRLKDAGFTRKEEFKRHIEILGRLKHPNLVPLRAYFQAKEECLLVYDYFPNGSLFSLIHGSRVSGSGKPLHWTSCLKIAEDLAMGLVYIHQNPTLITHGNLKSSNVLLGPDFESCLTDYGLRDLHDPLYSIEDTSAASLFYKAPECRDSRKASTQQADVYSFGVLLLELLTGKTSFHDLVHEHGSDISRWVRAVREAETESGEEMNSSEEKLQALLSIATACVAIQPEDRPVMREVLKMVKNARAEAVVWSSYSSDHSPGRWSDTVQSFPREDHMSI